MAAPEQVGIMAERELLRLGEAVRQAVGDKQADQLPAYPTYYIDSTLLQVEQLRWINMVLGMLLTDDEADEDEEQGSKPDEPVDPPVDEPEEPTEPEEPEEPTEPEEPVDLEAYDKAFTADDLRAWAKAEDVDVGSRDSKGELLEKLAGSNALPPLPEE